MSSPGSGGGRAPGAMLEALYGSVLEDAHLEDLNRLLAQATGSNIVAVLGHDVAHGRGRVAIVHGVDAARMDAALAEHDLLEDPWITRVVPQLATGKVIDSDQLLPRKQMQRTDAFHRYYRRLDIGQQVASVAHYDGGNSVTLSICREVGAAPFADVDLGLLRALTPHWVNAYAIQRRLSWLEQRVEALETAVDHMPTAMMLLDAQQQVLRMNLAAESLLSKGQLLALKDRRPHARFDPRPLQRLLQEACRGSERDGRQVRCGGSATLVDEGGRNALIVHAHPIGPQIGGGSEAAILFLQPVGAPAARDFKELLRTLFPLTAAEAMLAEAFYLHTDVAEAAQQAGISVSTAQTRLKVIYDKTGERGQPALLRLLSAIAAGAPPRNGAA